MKSHILEVVAGCERKKVNQVRISRNRVVIPRMSLAYCPRYRLRGGVILSLSIALAATRILMIPGDGRLQGAGVTARPRDGWTGYKLIQIQYI